MLYGGNVQTPDTSDYALRTEAVTDARDGITRCWLIIDSKTGESARASDRRAPLFSNERLVRAPRAPRMYAPRGSGWRLSTRRPVPRSRLRRRPGGASALRLPAPAGPAAVGLLRSRLLDGAEKSGH